MAHVSILSILVGVAVSGMLSAPHERPDFEAAFEELKTLVGEWEGEEQIVSYYLTGNGSALVEDLYRGSRHPSVGFTSVYHMDGDSLRMSHFCGAGNQPRLKAVAFDPEKRTVKFDFVDITNLSKPDAYHTRGYELILIDDDHMEMVIHGLANGEKDAQRIPLKRRK